MAGLARSLLDLNEENERLRSRNVELERDVSIIALLLHYALLSNLKPFVLNLRNYYTIVYSLSLFRF